MKKFIELSAENQSQLNQQWRKNELERRLLYYPRNTKEEIYPYYFKTEYINTWTYQDNHYFFVCPKCGEVAEFATLIKDIASSCQSRDVTVKCTCNNIYTYNA